MPQETILQGYKCIYLTKSQQEEAVPKTNFEGFSMFYINTMCGKLNSWIPADVVYQFRIVKLDKNNISEIVEINNCKVLIPFEYYDEFYSFMNVKKRLLIEKTIKYSELFAVTSLNLSEVIMKTGNKYLIIKN